MAVDMVVNEWHNERRRRMLSVVDGHRRTLIQVEEESRRELAELAKQKAPKRRKLSGHGASTEGPSKRSCWVQMVIGLA